MLGMRQFRCSRYRIFETSISQGGKGYCRQFIPLCAIVRKFGFQQCSRYVASVVSERPKSQSNMGMNSESFTHIRFGFAGELYKACGPIWFGLPSQHLERTR